MKHILILLGLALLGIILIVVQVPCRQCKGAGETATKVTERITCSYCQGRGKIEPELAKPSGAKSTFTHSKPACPQCGGSGYAEEQSLKKGPCRACDGKGNKPLYRWILDSTGL